LASVKKIFSSETTWPNGAKIGLNWLMLKKSSSLKLLGQMAVVSGVD
jgi:hypothetical protein